MPLTLLFTLQSVVFFVRGALIQQELQDPRRRKSGRAQGCAAREPQLDKSRGCRAAKKSVRCSAEVYDQASPLSAAQNCMERQLRVQAVPRGLPEARREHEPPPARARREDQLQRGIPHVLQKDVRHEESVLW